MIPPSDDAPPGSRPGDGQFPATRWSLVLRARGADERAAGRALSELCGAYWYPLYVYARRVGNGAEDAEDLTQGFFARLLEKDYFAEADQRRGRLRSFLLASFKHYMHDEWDKSRAQKRGGGETPLSIDAAMAEERYRLEPQDKASPDVVYERRWALTALENFVGALRDDYAAAGKAEVFDALQPHLTGDAEGGYAGAAEKLGISEGAARVAAHRLRKRYGEVMRREIAQTVETEDEVDDEIRTLFAALRG
ncbi:MAG: sigma-70 family RNA polymerase sigma factor [Verrucomicrobiales bacterium]